MPLAELAPLVLFVLAWVAAIAFPLVLLPWIMDRWGGLPYNSVPSRLLAWAVFAALVATVAVVAGGPGWDVWGWVAFAALVAFATAWDIRDMKVRRIPKGRHPDR